MATPMAKQCKTCIFRPRQRMITTSRLAEIQAYLLNGTPHLCHTSGDKACRGGRDYQLAVWHRLGLISDPTDAALASAMRASGVEPEFNPIPGSDIDHDPESR